MSDITKFYLKHAVYEVGIGAKSVTLLLNYGGNTYEVVGGSNKGKVGEIARLLLSKKHNVNFAYKFDGKINQGEL